MVTYITTEGGNKLYIEWTRTVEEENNYDEINVTEFKMNGNELNFDNFSDRYKEMIYDKLGRC